MRKKIFILYLLFTGFCLSAQDNLVGYEYWFNNDYPGRQTVVLVSAESHELNTSVDASALPEGVNVFNIRYKNSSGIYSSTLSEIFYKNTLMYGRNNQLTGYEFWFNNDYDGRQTGTIGKVGSYLLNTGVDVSFLPEGVNMFNIRFKNEDGIYSSTLSEIFYKSSTIFNSDNLLTAYEFWFNNDYGSRQTVSAGTSKTELINTGIDASLLPEGVNVFNVRSIDNKGKYSSTLSQVFIKTPKNQIETNLISAYRYWFNDDFSGVKDSVLITDVAQFNLTDNLDLASLPKGRHAVNFQVSDIRGNWSVVSTDSINKTPVPVALFSVSNNPVCSNSIINLINESIDGNTWLWDFGDGNTSSDFEPVHFFADPGDYEVRLTATDSITGRDSTVTQILSVLPSFETVETVEICNGEIYSWYGNEYSNPGTYIETFTAVNGCDSSIVLQLSVNPEYNVFYSGDGIVPNFIVNDSFEGDEVGSLAGWTKLYNGTGDANQKVVDTMAKNGLKSLQLEGRSSWASEYYKVIPDNPEKLVIEGWINVEKILLGLTGGFGLADISIGTWGTRTSRLQFYNGRINVTYTGGLTYDIQSYTAGEWYHIRMEHDLVGKVYSVYINGQKMSGTSGSITTDEFPMHPSISSKQFLLFAGNSGTTKVFFDDLNMYENNKLEICSVDLPFEFGSQLLMESGRYSETFSSIYGCDSTVILDLEVIPSYNITENITVCQTDLPYEFGSQILTEEGEYNEIYTLSSGCDSVVTLNFKIRDCSIVCEEMRFSPGWNIFSVNSLPDSLDIEYLFNPLIDNSTLVKIQDESGNSLEDWGIFGGWTNNIGDINPQEGYKIKVRNNDSIEICGMPVQYPYAIPLKSGWNIMGYPQTASFDGMESIVQQLIDKGALVKVQDEQGNSIEDWGIFGGWTNNIGDFVPGKGYKIKVNTTDTLWIYNSYPKSSVILPDLAATTHFNSTFIGNGVDHMNINLVGLPVNVLNTGDELGVFDGETCVGAVKIMSFHLHNQTVSVVASAKDEQGMEGFTEGNLIVLKFWNSVNNKEFVLEPDIVNGTSSFIKNESTFASLEKYATTGLEGIPGSNSAEINCYPNPFTDEISIEISLKTDAKVEVEVLNQMGQNVKKLEIEKIFTTGTHRLIWNGSNTGNQLVSSGIYFIRILIDGEIYFKKVIFEKE